MLKSNITPETAIIKLRASSKRWEAKSSRIPRRERVDLPHDDFANLLATAGVHTTIRSLTSVLRMLSRAVPSQQKPTIKTNPSPWIVPHAPKTKKAKKGKPMAVELIKIAA